MTATNMARVHAAQRAQQRGISPAVIDLLFRFGWECPAGDGCVCLQMDNRGARQAARYAGKDGAQLVERARGMSLILASDGSIVTVQHRTRRSMEKYRPWRVAA